MGRYSPPAFVTDRSGELLAEALNQASSGFFGGIERGRERRHQRDIEQQQHDDAILGMELSHPGLHRPGPPAPTGQGNALASALPNSPLIDDEYGSGQGPVASSTDGGFGHSLADALPMSSPAPMSMKPANSGRGMLPPGAVAPPAPTPGHPGAFDPATGAFRDGKGVPKIGSQPVAAPAPAAPRVRQLTGGWTMNDDESDAALMHGKELERAFADRDRTRKVQSLMKAYQIPQEKAEALVDNPGLADNALYPTAKAPAIGSPEWIRNRIGELQRGGMSLTDANKRARLEGGEQNATPPSEIDPKMKFQADQKNKIIDDFARDTKKFEDVVAGYEVLKGAIQNPSLATPFALADAYARISNPGAVVRPSTMEMLEHMGSIDQRIRKAVSLGVNAQLPPDVTRDWVKTIMGIVNEHAATFQSIRGQAIKRAGQEKISDIDPILWNPTFEDPMASHSAVSDADFARAWQGGARTDADIAKWLNDHPLPKGKKP